jgi:hypothetical protein
MPTPRRVEVPLVGVQSAGRCLDLQQKVFPTKANNQITDAFASEMQRIDGRAHAAQGGDDLGWVLVNSCVSSHGIDP